MASTRLMVVISARKNRIRMFFQAISPDFIKGRTTRRLTASGFFEVLAGIGIAFTMGSNLHVTNHPILYPTYVFGSTALNIHKIGKPADADPFFCFQDPQEGVKKIKRRIVHQPVMDHKSAIIPGGGHFHVLKKRCPRGCGARLLPGVKVNINRQIRQIQRGGRQLTPASGHRPEAV